MYAKFPTTHKIVSALFSISSTVEVKVHFKHLYAKLVMLHVLLPLFSVSACIGIIIPVCIRNLNKQQLPKYVLVQNESWKYFHFPVALKREACLRKLYQSYFFKTDSTLVVALTSLERRFGLSCFCCNCIFLFHTRFPKSKSACRLPYFLIKIEEKHASRNTDIPFLFTMTIQSQKLNFDSTRFN